MRVLSPPAPAGTVKLVANVAAFGPAFVTPLVSSSLASNTPFMLTSTHTAVRCTMFRFETTVRFISWPLLMVTGSMV